MNIKRFRGVCRFTSIILKIAAILIGSTAAVSLFSYFFTNTDIWFNFSMPDFPILNSGSGPVTEADKQLAALIIVPFRVIVSFYVYWKGSQLFKYLADGNPPFSNKFTHTLKRISLILIITDIAFPLIYSLLVTIIMEGRHYLIIGVGSSLMIGLILYAVSEIFKYALTLQQLADDTV